jgi:hypothetical protein
MFLVISFVVAFLSKFYVPSSFYQCVLHSLPIFSSLTYSNYVRFEVFTAVTMKNGVFWVVTPCGSCKNPEDTILLILIIFGK